MDPATINESIGLVWVLKTMEVSTSRKSTENVMSAPEKFSVEQTASKESESESTPYPNIFAIGDAVDVFSAIPAGYNAYAQVSLASSLGICSFTYLVSGDPGGTRSQKYYQIYQEHCVGIRVDNIPESLEDYTPSPPAIKVFLGLVGFIFSLAPLVHH